MLTSSTRESDHLSFFSINTHTPSCFHLLSILVLFTLHCVRARERESVCVCERERKLVRFVCSPVFLVNRTICVSELGKSGFTEGGHHLPIKRKRWRYSANLR